jgi:GNAT superfamily N-acetyltransferase
MTAVGSIRRPVCQDRQALADMLERCSRLTIQRRFHGPRSTFPEKYLTDAVYRRYGHYALLAEAADGSVVALASCVSVAVHVADLAVLVEDRYQRRGIGSALLEGLLRHADRSGISMFKTNVLAEQQWIVAGLRRYGRCAARVSRGVFDVTMCREEGQRTWIS